MVEVITGQFKQIQKYLIYKEMNTLVQQLNYFEPH